VESKIGEVLKGSYSLSAAAPAVLLRMAAISLLFKVAKDLAAVKA
jgi:hypothetical protein